MRTTTMAEMGLMNLPELLYLPAMLTISAAFAGEMGIAGSLGIIAALALAYALIMLLTRSLGRRTWTLHGTASEPAERESPAPVDSATR